MKFFIYCDFSTLKCTKFEFAKKLQTISTNFCNINDFFWEIEIDELSLIPYSDNSCETLYHQLEDFVDSHSILKVFKVEESFGNEAP